MSKKLYWSPGVTWKIKDNKLYIAQNIFDERAIELFPKLYFEFSNGLEQNKIYEIFPKKSRSVLSQIIRRLINSKILICDIQDIHDLFTTQSKLFEQYNTYDNTVNTDMSKKLDFIENALSREIESSEIRVNLLDIPVNDENIANRCSTREFDTSKQLGYKQFSELFAILRQHRKEGKRRYYYPCSGGLYPIDIYIYIKKGRVQHIKEGLYYFDPVANALNMISRPDNIDEEINFFTNKDIFKSSAATIYFVYNAKANMPKYGGAGYFFGIIDSGIIINALSVQAEKVGLGSCSIGEIDFDRIKSNFQLGDNQQYLHCMEIGIKK